MVCTFSFFNFFLLNELGKNLGLTLEPKVTLYGAHVEDHTFRFSCSML